MNEFRPGFRVREVRLADGRTLTLGLTCWTWPDEQLLDAAREAAERLAVGAQSEVRCDVPACGASVLVPLFEFPKEPGLRRCAAHLTPKRSG